MVKVVPWLLTGTFTLAERASRVCGGEPVCGDVARLGRPEASGFASSDRAPLPAPGMPGMSLGGLSSSKPSTPQASQLRTRLLAAVEKVVRVRDEGPADRQPGQGGRPT